MLRSLIVAAAVLAAAPADAFLARNDLVVRATGEGRFDVPFRGSSRPGDFWCAAGDYVLRDLGLPGTTRIYRTSSPPRRAGDGISFSLSAEGAKKPGLLIILHDGRGVSASHALSLCDVKVRSD